MSDALVDGHHHVPHEPPTPRLAVVIPFPAHRSRSVEAEAEARRRHPSARTG